MHVYSNIIMHSVQNPNYIYIYIYLKKNLEKKKKNSWPRVMFTRGSHMVMCLNYTWPFGHMAAVNNPRGHVGTCNKYTCPNGHM
jgi:hypothetical protein